MNRSLQLWSWLFRVGVGALVFGNCERAIGQARVPLAKAASVDSQNPNEELVSIDYQEPVELRDLVKTVSYWTNKNVLIDSKVTGKIQILSPKKVTKGEAYQAFLSAVDSLGFGVVETGQMIRIQPKRDLLVGAYTPLLGMGQVNYSDRVYTQIFHVAHLNADVLRSALSQLVSSSSMFVYAPTNSLILTDTGFNLRKVAEFISIADVSSAELRYEFIHLKNMHATEAAKLVTDIFNVQTDGPKSPLKVIVNESTNSLVVSGTVEQMRRARASIAEIDKPSPRMASKSGIYVRPVMFSDAKKLASVLSAIGQTEKNASKNGTDKEDTKLEITADDDTNSLLFRGSASAYRSMSGIVRRLDEAKAQVFLEFSIVSLSEASNFNFLPGMLAGAGSSDGTGTKTIVGYEASVMTPLIVAQTSPANTVPAITGAAAAFGTDLTLGVFPGGSMYIPGIGNISPGGLLTILKKDSYGRALSSPRILAMDSEESSFTVGNTILYLSSTVNSTENTIQTVEKQDVDLTVKVKPTMSDSEYFSLQIEIESNTVERFYDNGNPLVAKKKARQLVNFKNGQTILISGIRNLNRSNVEKTIPLLGSIPVIGYFLTSKKIENTADYTFIFVTGHIVRDAGDLQAMYEKKFKDEDPHKPRLMMGSKDTESE